MGTALLLLLLVAAAQASRGMWPAFGSPADNAADRAASEAEAARERSEAADRAAKESQRAETMPPAWPVAVPTDLPPFPSGWTFAEPVPPAVRTRAWQLLQSLWSKGKGSKAVELTGGEWITYRAEITKGNKRGVVAYRTKRPLAPAPGKPASSARLPPIDSRSPGLPVAVLPLPAPAPGAGAKPQPTLHQGAGMGALAHLAAWVKELQLRLRVFPADGKFGRDTRDAVVAFQRSKRLKADGVVGPATWGELDKLWKVSVGPALLLAPAQASV